MDDKTTRAVLDKEKRGNAWEKLSIMKNERVGKEKD